MVIDKTTGKGCAWSIASKTITKKLIADGIVDKLIFRKLYQKSSTMLRVVDLREPCAYVVSERGSEFAEEPLWVPSFIDTEIWNRAVSKFQSYERLDQNVEKHLISEMDEYLQSIPDTELVSITKDFLIEQGVLNTPICQRAGATYYFNENGVYSLDETSSLFPYEKRIKFGMFGITSETCFNMNVWRKAVSQFEVGMTLEECIGHFLRTELVHRVSQKLSPVDRLVQYISPPMYERVPENMDESTFDRIRITVGLPRYQFDSWEAVRNEVEKHQVEIRQRVIQKLENERQFKKYGVPINFLKLSDVILLRNFSIEFIFELKEQEIK